MTISKILYTVKTIIIYKLSDFDEIV